MRLLTWVVLLLASGAMARPEPSFVLEFEDGYVATGPQGPLAPRAEGHPELAPGRFGQALKSGPATGYLHFPTAGVVNRLAGTVEMWVSPIDWDGTERKFHAFFDCRGEGALYLYKYFEGGLLMLSANNPAGPYQSASAAIGGWKPGDWHHIAGTWSASQQHVYVDGKRIGSTSPLLPMALAETFALGDHPWHIERSSSSLIDRVRIYDRLLSDAHIAAHYAGNYDHSVPVGASSVTLTAPIEPATRTLTATGKSKASQVAQWP
ncbi:MAG: LamG domain-containing protein [Armatimonadetes bacterium]|nr:LamG domain-containing protein [Armatimonadota bacterium]